MSDVNIIISQLSTATSVVVFILSFINFIPGLIGLLLNVIIFTRPSLRNEPCAVYFLSSSCFNLFVVFIILPVRILSNGFNIDMANYNQGICKIEFFVFFVVRSTSCWLIVLACIDRFLHSSISLRLRQLSSLKTARISISIIIIIMLILYIHMIIYYDVTTPMNQLAILISVCNPQKGIYRTFISFWHMVWYSLCPSFLMLLFGCLTLNNIRQHRRVVPTIGERNLVGRRTDNQLLRMLLAQVLAIIISTLPYSILNLYTSFTANISKDTLRITIENFVAQTANTIAFFAHTSSFYLYTLTGTVFRKEFFRIISCCYRSNLNQQPIMFSKTNKTSTLQKNPQVININNDHIQE